VLAAFGLSGIGGCLRNRSQDPRDYGGETVQYADDEGVAASAQSLDVYPAPTGTDAGPVVLYVHGGGWINGDKQNVHNKPEWVRESHDGVFVSTNYRLTDVTDRTPKHPAHIQDVARATDWVLENVAQYGGDPDRVFVMGHSAGAHLVALLATAEEYLEATGHSTSVLSGVFPIDGGLYDLVWAAKQGSTRRKLIEGAIGTDEPTQRAASPQHRVDEDDDLPPFVLAYTNAARGTATRRFVGVLDDHGVETTVMDRTDIGGIDVDKHLKINRQIGTDGDPLTETLDDVIQSQ
jgi:acetyl esterase/lipase